MNERWKVLTYRDYDFEEKGQRITGRTLHCYRENSENGWPGVEYSKFSIGSSYPAYKVIPTLGLEYEFVFNRYGKVFEIILV